jgi:N,N-dimethylformamidase
VLVGYVSDEYFAAVPDALVELAGPEGSTLARSSASGAVIADGLAPGTYEVTLAKPGFSAKRTTVCLPSAEVHQFRLLSGAPSGYAWPKWVRAGERSELCLNCAEPFSVELWRYGREAEHVRDIGYWDNHPPGATVQILPDGDFTQTGAQWSRHGYAFPSFDPRTSATAPDRSGLYYFHMRSESGAFFSFPWVVAPASPAAPVAVLASNITWNAYNDYGGRSNYTAPSGLPPAPSVNVRQEELWFTDPDMEAWSGGDYPPLSFDRPEPLNRVFPGEQITDPLRRLGSEHVAPAEWRLLGWLEREGFGYDLYAETQLHENLLDLDQYRVLVLSTHPEYWTRAMYERVRDWVYERGGKLAYLGGNGINCEVEFLDQSRMAVHNLDWGVRQAEFESRFHMRGESSARLLGTATTMAGYETGAPYRVLDAGHWVFAGTGLADGDLFGSASLDRRAVGGASGHETDKITGSAPGDLRLLAKGVNPDDGGGDMVYFGTPSGGAVFSVGSISYTCSIVVDDTISAVTRNVLRRFLT